MSACVYVPAFLIHLLIYSILGKKCFRQEVFLTPFSHKLFKNDCEDWHFSHTWLRDAVLPLFKAPACLCTQNSRVEVVELDRTPARTNVCSWTKVHYSTGFYWKQRHRRNTKRVYYIIIRCFILFPDKIMHQYLLWKLTDLVLCQFYLLSMRFNFWWNFANFACSPCSNQAPESWLSQAVCD